MDRFSDQTFTIASILLSPQRGGIIFEVGIQDYQRLKQKIQEPEKKGNGGLRSQFIERLSGVLSVSDPDVDKIDPKSIWKNVVE
ncbi:MAG: hypothetical protein Q6373_001620 [Candidatus Sigynarchaeota archaeon]